MPFFLNCFNWILFCFLYIFFQHYVFLFCYICGQGNSARFLKYSKIFILSVRYLLLLKLWLFLYQFLITAFVVAVRSHTQKFLNIYQQNAPHTSALLGVVFTSVRLLLCRCYAPKIPISQSSKAAKQPTEAANEQTLSLALSPCWQRLLSALSQWRCCSYWFILLEFFLVVAWASETDDETRERLLS